MPSNAPPVTVTAPDLRAPHRYIAVEGPIGVGKTSLVQRLAERWPMRPLLEKPEDNPFLARFYGDMPRYALSTELQFAIQRAQEAGQTADILAHGGAVVTDFIAQKSGIFARLTLDDDEWRLYEALVGRIALGDAPVPDLVIHLQASPPTLLSRVHKRARADEARITEAYLRELGDAYDQFFYHYDDSPVLTVNTEHLDLLDSDADFALLLEHIETMRGRKASFVKAL
ncbi:deoxynucleoside kinase [Trinickia diaoshuihuensis]|jgi:deoxyadenosine/deoxycytidine kinase|uniref:deoxynucleoside kinase n=1 Tax=Trinickia diaoshuihuensis TaxID=2292265 RepID=UPI000E27C5ED|nr:deoxynucleoside kinase [Trinickia diaoshuihuensis]